MGIKMDAEIEFGKKKRINYRHFRAISFCQHAMLIVELTD